MMRLSVLALCAAISAPFLPLQALAARKGLSRQDHLNRDPVDQGTTSIFSGVNGFFSHRSKSGESGAELFIRSFKLGMKAANEQLPSKDGKRVVDNGGKGQRRITIKQWADVNAALKKARDALIPEGYGEKLIETVFASKIRDKYGKAVRKTNSKSGSIIVVSDYDNVTKSRYVLKSEKRGIFRRGMYAIHKEYGEQIAPKESECSETTMMKVLLVFEPLDSDKLVDTKVWTLIQNVNPFPPRDGNIVEEYDLKHSRPVDNCKSSDPKEGLLGDFLRDFGNPLRHAVAEPHPFHGVDGSLVHLKKTCLMSTISKDLSVIDSAYPDVKLVDLSVLVFAIRPKDDEPTDEEMSITNSRKNIFKVYKNVDGKIQTWFLIYSLIDLFAPKNKRKWWQSHWESRDFIFSHTKFSLYPFYAFCMSQYLLYYTKIESSANASTTWEGQIGENFEVCYQKGDIRDKRHELDKYGAVHGREDTKNLHDAIRYDDRMCSLLQTCDGVLHKEEVSSNILTCCRNANDGNPCDL